MDRKAHLQRVSQLCQQRDFRAALDAVDAALADLPADPALLMRRGMILREMQSVDASINLLKELMQSHPDRRDVQNELAVSLRSAGQFDDSLMVLAGLLESDPTYRAAHWTKIVTLAHARQFDAATQAANEALERFPDDVGLLTRRAVILRERQQVEDSIEALKSLIEKFPDDPYPRHELAVSRRSAGQNDQSLTLSETILSDDPNYRPALWARTITHMQSRDHAKALGAVDQALNVFPGDVQFLTKRAIILRDLHRTAESVDALRALSHQYPDMLDVHHELALSLRASGASTEANALHEGILTQHPTFRPALLAQIETHLQTSNFDAISEMLRAVPSRLQGETNPTHVETHLKVVASAIRHVPSLVGEAPWLWPMIQRHLDGFSPDELLSIHDAYALHGRETEENLSQTIIDALFAKSTLTQAACAKIINILHAGMPANFDTLVENVIARAPAGDRGYLHLYLASIVEPAEVALAARKKLIPGARRFRDLMLLTRLIRQAGKLPVAARYWRFLRRAFPDDLQIRHQNLSMLLVAEDVKNARQELDLLAPQLDRLPIAFAALVLSGYVTIGEIETAHKLYLQFSDSIGGKPAVLDAAIRIKQGLGLMEDADKLFKLRRNLANSADTLRIVPTIVGVIQGEFEVAKRDKTDANTPRLTAHVTSVIRAHLSDPQDVRNVSADFLPQRIIHQYWDNPVVPEELIPMIDTWRAAEGFEHVLYDKRTARRILSSELGADWAGAFRNAASPAEESDFFRLCILMLRGGIYVDCDDILIGDLGVLHQKMRGFTVFAEPLGHTGNNLIACYRGHQAVKLAAIAAKTALEGRHNDNTWVKTGPGLISRIVAGELQNPTKTDRSDPITVYPRNVLPGFVQMHVPLPYKRTGAYWNSSQDSHAYDAIMKALAQ